MSAEAERVAVQECMIRLGGGFVKALGKACLEADNGHHFAVEVLNMHRVADDENHARLRIAFPDLWAVFDMREEDRLTYLRDAFESFFEKYAAMAKEKPQGA